MARTEVNSLPSQSSIIELTRRWLETVVIGLDLCPFAKGVFVTDKIRYRVSEAEDERGLVDELSTEIEALAGGIYPGVETSLLIVPKLFPDFLDFNEFLEKADNRIDRLGYRGVVQVASFHPQYQFADTEPDDVENSTNRSPFPMLHLLLEDSISAVTDYPGGLEAIPDRNIELLRKLGADGFKKIWPRDKPG